MGRAGPRTLAGCEQHMPSRWCGFFISCLVCLLSDPSVVLAFLSGVGMELEVCREGLSSQEVYHKPFKYLDAEVIFRAKFTNKNHQNPAPGIKFCLFFSLQPNTLLDTHLTA